MHLVSYRWIGLLIAGAALLAGETVLFARAPDLEKDRITLIFAAPGASGYPVGTPVPFVGNLRDVDALGPALDWRDRSTLYFSAAAANAASKRPDIYEVHYRVR